MIRQATPENSAAILELAVAAGLFTANEVSALDNVLADYFADNGDPADVWVIDDDGGTRGVASYTKSAQRAKHGGR